MTNPAELLEHLAVTGPLAVDDNSRPFGTAWLPESGHGIDLSAHGYVEHEYLLHGSADSWTWNGDFTAIPAGASSSFVTRVVVRRPADPAAFSGVVQLEPHHHMSNDRALSWAAIGPWIVRSGHAHVGFTHEPLMVALLADWDPERYGSLSIENHTLRWDIAGQVAVAIRNGALPDFAQLPADRIVLSGWSMTGTFCRTFLGEGFHERWRHGGEPAINGYLVCISSGAAVYRGYEMLLGDEILPADAPRRTIEPRGVPIIELLTEAESETQQPVLREDSDTPGDRYRFYQVAGTGHHVDGARRSLNTNDTQRHQRSAPAPAAALLEPPTDARMDLVARAVFEMLDRWISDGVPPPAHTPRFSWGAADSPGPRGLMEEALPLLRDPDQNVVGGIRPPWIELPSGSYLPHSTPDLPDRGPRVAAVLKPPYPKEPDPHLVADLVPCLLPFSVQELQRRYGSREQYLVAYAARIEEFVRQGWLRSADAAELLDDKRSNLPDF
jgi:hypothetical protein